MIKNKTAEVLLTKEEEKTIFLKRDKIVTDTLHTILSLCPRFAIFYLSVLEESLFTQIKKEENKLKQVARKVHIINGVDTRNLAALQLTIDMWQQCKTLYLQNKTDECIALLLNDKNIFTHQFVFDTFYQMIVPFVEKQESVIKDLMAKQPGNIHITDRLIDHQISVAYGNNPQNAQGYKNLLGLLDFYKADINKLKDKILMPNKMLIYKTIHNVAKMKTIINDNIEELSQEGNIGLIIAFEKFNPYLDLKFSTYGTTWIQQRVRKYLSNFGSKSGVYTLPSNIKTIKYKITNWQKDHDFSCLDDVIDKFRHENKKYSDEEIRLAWNNINLENVYTTKNTSKTQMTENEVYEINQDNKAISAEDEQVKREVISTLLESIGELNDPMKSIFTDFYNFETDERLTMSNIGKMYDIPQYKVKRILEEGKEIIKEKMYNKIGEVNFNIL